MWNIKNILSMALLYDTCMKTLSLIFCILGTCVLVNVRFYVDVCYSVLRVYVYTSIFKNSSSIDISVATSTLIASDASNASNVFTYQTFERA